MPYTKTVPKFCCRFCTPVVTVTPPFNVAPSAIQAPINPFKPKELSSRDIYKTIDQYVRAGKLAQKAGYDGVEIMGSEGYFITQMINKRTNQR